MKKVASPIRRYCRQVKKHLVCSRASKAALIKGLSAELQEKYPDCRDYRQLISGNGYPEIIAGEFQSAIELPEYYKALRARKLLSIGIASVVILCCVGITAHYVNTFYNGTITTAKSTIIGCSDSELPEDWLVEGEN